MTTPITPLTSGASTQKPSRNPLSFDPDMFLKLLVAQMRYQDPSKPMDSSELLDQSSALSTVEMLQRVSETQDNLLSYQSVIFGSSLVGKTVTAIGLDGLPVTGKVDSARIEDGNAYVMIGTKKVPVINVTDVS